MPIYEYVCKACGQETEIIHGLSETPPKKCPACGKPKLSKLVSAAGFRLKGGGWYETDFKSGGKKNLVGDTQEAPAPTVADKPAAVAKTETKSEAKPAAKPVAKSDKKSAAKKPGSRS